MNCDDFLDIVLTRLSRGRPANITSDAFEQWAKENAARLRADACAFLAHDELAPTRATASAKAQGLLGRLVSAAERYAREWNYTTLRRAAYEQWKREERDIRDAALEADAHLPSTSRILEQLIEDEARRVGSKLAAAREEVQRFERLNPAARRALEPDPREEPEPSEEPRSVLVELPRDGGDGLWLRKLTHLNHEAYQAYLGAVGNLQNGNVLVRDDRGRSGYSWYSRGTSEAMAIAVEALQRLGFQVHAATPAAAERLAQGAAQSRARVDAADRHLAEVVTRLAARGLRPRPYQMVGIRWLQATVAGLLLDVMGLGKTMQILLAMGDRGIVLCPSTVKSTWKRECQQWRPDLRYVSIEQYGALRYPERGELIVSTYDLVRLEKPAAAPFDGTIRIPNPTPSSAGKIEVHVVSRTGIKAFKVPAGRILVKAGDHVTFGTPLYRHHDDVTALGPAPRGVCLAIDEAQNLKNPATMAYRAAKALGESIHAAGGHVWAATATPLPNRPDDLKGILELVGAFKTAFATEQEWKYAFGGNTRSAEKAKPTPAAAASLARVALRRARADVRKDLPPVVLEKREVKLTGEAATVAAALERDLRPVVEQAENEARLAGKSSTEIAAAIERAMLKARTIGQMARDRRIIAGAKIPAALELITSLEEVGDPVVVISAFKEICEMLTARDPEGWVAITGDVSQKDREKYIEGFQAGRYKGISLTIKTGGAGIDLTRASYGVAVDLEWNPADNEQAFARIDPVRGRPPGVEDGPSRWYVLEDDSWIQGRITQLTEAKKEVADAVVDPIAELGGQLPEGVDLAAVAIAPPEVRAPAPPRAPAHWITDKATLDRVRAFAKEPRMPSLLKFLVRMADERGGIPPSVQSDYGPRVSVLQELERMELLLHNRREQAEQYARAAREARSEIESFAADALLQLAELDPDRAMKRNDVGFAASTQDGHRLAALIRSGVGLTDKDWRRAVAIARHHHRQVGPAPLGQEEVAALARCGREEIRACQDDVTELHDGHGPVLVRTRCNYDPREAEAFKRNIAAWRPHLDAWASTLRLVARKAGIARECKPGLLLCNDNKAYTTSGLGTPVVYLQPELLQEVISNEPDPHAVAAYLHYAATHELAHLNGLMGHGHSDEFVAAREDLGQRTGAVMPQIVEIAERLLQSASSTPKSCCPNCAAGAPCQVSRRRAEPA